jgi:alpha-ketoglutarate-dependent 2,4-dichlorophenoxyacetate dioxygenase
MSLKLQALHPYFVAEASGIDLTQPLSSVDVKAINAAMNQYAVLVWKNQ